MPESGGASAIAPSEAVIVQKSTPSVETYVAPSSRRAALPLGWEDMGGDQALGFGLCEHSCSA